MKAVLQGGFTENFDEFSALIDKEEKGFKPLGDLIHNFSTEFIPKPSKVSESSSNAKPKPHKNGVSGTNGHGSNVGVEKCFEIYLVDAVTTPKFVEYLKRIESFLLFFVDAASCVEAEGNDKWKFFTL